MSREHLRPPWKPGQSGNPGGRPKQQKVLAEWVREKFENPLEREHLWKRARKSDYLMGLLLAYGFGRPPKEIQVAGTILTRIIDVFPDGRQVVREVSRQSDSAALPKPS